MALTHKITEQKKYLLVFCVYKKLKGKDLFTFSLLIRLIC